MLVKNVLVAKVIRPAKVGSTLHSSDFQAVFIKQFGAFDTLFCAVCAKAKSQKQPAFLAKSTACKASKGKNKGDLLFIFFIAVSFFE